MLVNKVEICGVDTSKLPVMKHKEMKELMLKIKTGDQSAREEFIRGNLRLVLSVIQRFTGRNENMDDLFQVGCIGLIKAIDNFNVELGVRFSTYAVPMIQGELRRYLRDNNSIRVSRSLRDIAYKALQVRNTLSKTNFSDPSVEKIAKELGMKVEDVVFALDAIQDPVSLYEPVYHDGTDAIYVMDQLQDKNSADENWLEGIALKEAISRLNEREKKIIMMRFYQGKTQMEVSDEIGISQAQVSRLEKNALKNIKRNI
jgi:RNA polymerase sporulation-specific sigma factor